MTKSEGESHRILLPLKLPPLRHPMKGGMALEGPHVGRKEAEADRAAAVAVVDAVDQWQQLLAPGGCRPRTGPADASPPERDRAARRRRKAACTAARASKGARGAPAENRCHGFPRR